MKYLVRIFTISAVAVLIGLPLHAKSGGSRQKKTAAAVLKDPEAARLEIEMQKNMQRFQGISYDELKRLHHQDYLEHLDFDVTRANYYDQFIRTFGLNNEAKSVLDNLGFAVVPSPGVTEQEWDDDKEKEVEKLFQVGPADIYYRVFAADLPVFISADSILHAWHRTFEEGMMEVEAKVFCRNLRQILDAAIEKLEPNDPKTKDALFYLSAARRLLDNGLESMSEEEASNDMTLYEEFPDGFDPAQLFKPHPSVAHDVDLFVSYVLSHRLDEVTFMGRRAAIDFSQFIPRGYYAKSARLTRYFYAMTWLGQIDLVLYNPSKRMVDSPREEQAAREIARALAESGTMQLYQEMERFYSTIIGRSNAFSPTALLQACEAGASPKCSVLSKDLLSAYATATEPGYSSRVFENEHPPVAMRFFPKRFSLDAWVLAQAVLPKLKPAELGGRAMAMAEDIAFALGADRAAQYYAAEMEKPHRENLPAVLAAVRQTMDEAGPEASTPSVYNHWLEALRAASRATVNPSFPQTMRTAAYHDRKMETVLSSLAELRHDTVLIVEQSVGGVGCQYPKGYVEPVPELYRALGRAASLFFSAFGDAAKRMFADRLQTDDNSDIDSNLMGHWKRTMERLAVMAEKELKGETMNDAELQFLNETVDLHREEYTGDRMYNGWYPMLYWEDSMSVGESKPVVGDIHTDADAREVLQIGTGHPGLMIIAVDNNGDLSLFGGPVYNYYSFVYPMERRMTDGKWEKLLQKGRAPLKPPFTKSYWIPSNKTKSVDEKPGRRGLGALEF